MMCELKYNISIFYSFFRVITTFFFFKTLHEKSIRRSLKSILSLLYEHVCVCVRHNLILWNRRNFCDEWDFLATCCNRSASTTKTCYSLCWLRVHETFYWNSSQGKQHSWNIHVDLIFCLIFQKKKVYKNEFITPWISYSLSFLFLSIVVAP